MPPEPAVILAVALALGVEESPLATCNVCAFAVTITSPTISTASHAVMPSFAKASASLEPPPLRARAATLTLPRTDALPEDAERNRLAEAEADRPRFWLFA